MAALALAALLLAAACESRAPDVGHERERRVHAALASIVGRFEDALTRARWALRELPSALDAAGPTVGERFAAVARVREAAALRGLRWDNPSGSPVWAGTPVEPRDLPDPPAPWARSVAHGNVVYHAGPFLRALLVADDDPRRTAMATAVLDDAATSGPFRPPAEERWAEELGVATVRILPPEVLARPAPAGTARAAIAVPHGGPPVLAVEVESRGDEEIAAALAAQARGTGGWLALAGLALATAAAAAAIQRWSRPALVTSLLLAALPLAVRHGVRLLDLGGRFEWLAPLTNNLDFAMTGHFGWLATPAGLFATCVALLLSALGLARASAAVKAPGHVAGRLVSALVGVALVAVGTAEWLFFVESGTTHGRIDLFATGALWPGVPQTTMLAALVAATATAWVLARAGLRRVVAVTPAPLVAGALAAVAATTLAGLLYAHALPPWAPYVVPGAALVVGRLTPGASRPGAPTRILLVSVVATAALLPVLWRASQDALRPSLRAQVDAMVRGPQTAASELPAKLRDIADDPALVRVLDRYGSGPTETDGLAIHVWDRLGFRENGADDVAIYVYDREDKRIDRFGLNTPPFERLPNPQPDFEHDDEPISVVHVPWDGRRVGATIGRLRLRTAEGRALGTVSVVLPDRLDVALSGAGPVIAARPPGAGDRSWVEDAEVCVVRDSHVELAVDPPDPASLPPAAAMAKVEESAWLPAGDGSAPWLVAPAQGRGTVLARPRERSFEDVLFGLARAAVVGAGAGLAVALLVFLATIRSFRPRLQDKILAAYLVVSVVPFVLLGYAGWRDARVRAEEDFVERQREVARMSRRELEVAAPAGQGYAQNAVANFAIARGQDLSLYQDGELQATTMRGLVYAELLPARLDAAVYRAVELERRDLVVRVERIAGRQVRVAYTPLRSLDGVAGTLSVPLLFDSERADRRAAATGSVLLAAYLVAIVLLVVLGLYTARGLARRLTALSEATRSVAAGNLDVELPLVGRDEVGGLVRAFNAMAGDLKRLREREALAEREQAWRGMARQVAHEIKNPLTPMKLMLQQLVATSRQDPRAAAGMIEPTAKVVLEQIDTLSRIASDFSAFARFPPRSLVEVDVNDVLRSVALLYTGGESARETIETDLAPDLPAVRWDRDELRRVFVNLVANAVQAVDEGKGRVRVSIRSCRAPAPGSGREGVLVTVADDGVGIPPDHMPRLFQPDFSTKTHGTGLGLAIVKRIVGDLGGEIRIASEPGHGTTVSTWLPAATPP
ncbi:MAG: HAMP domain-containing protein [Planctomycetes bacterium]|nr:HAMP domain-containing protein [Planctomycetota bacterium]